MKNNNKKRFRVIELFAGVGGFRVGFNQVKQILKTGRAKEKDNWDFVWANQWEPSSRTQEAFKIYEKRFGKSTSHVNQDIFIFNKSSIPDHDVLVGGFPCQDYSVARSLSGEKGIEGKKGVLWWEIYKTIENKNPPYVLLENVDRLLKSPSKKRGRDFGIMLASLNNLGYNVEWRVLNAAELGYPQKRKRVFIFAKRNELKSSLKELSLSTHDIAKSKGFFSKSFKVLSVIKENSIDLSSNDLAYLSDNFTFDFYNFGYMKKGKIFTASITSVLRNQMNIDSILDYDSDKSKFIVNENIDKWKYLKGKKKIERTSKTGYKYVFSEGAISFPDPLNKPARTMLTSEGTLNRSSHIILDKNLNKMRTLTPIEAERLNGFPDNWTEDITNRKRFFMMGNALVCGLVEDMSKILRKLIHEDLE
jgi:DNA (cytosine-5)-methyltransferase 1